LLPEALPQQTVPSRSQRAYDLPCWNRGPQRHPAAPKATVRSAILRQPKQLLAAPSCGS